jgi:low temperature requirement protein LtrA
MTLVQIGAVLVIAAAAMQATSDRAPAFAIAYGAFRLILAARYAMAAHYVREARRECRRQSSASRWPPSSGSHRPAVPAPWRFWMWGVGFGIDLLTPFASPRMHEIVPPDPDHIEERFGTFINISLGEGSWAWSRRCGTSRGPARCSRRRHSHC